MELKTFWVITVKDKFIHEWIKRKIQPASVVMTNVDDYFIAYTEDPFIHHRYFSAVGLWSGEIFGSPDNIDELGRVLAEKVPNLQKIRGIDEDMKDYIYEF